MDMIYQCAEIVVKALDLTMWHKNAYAQIYENPLLAKTSPTIIAWRTLHIPYFPQAVDFFSDTIA